MNEKDQDFARMIYVLLTVLRDGVVNDIERNLLRDQAYDMLLKYNLDLPETERKVLTRRSSM